MKRAFTHTFHDHVSINVLEITKRLAQRCSFMTPTKMRLKLLCLEGGQSYNIVLGSNKPFACIRTTAANEKKTENPTCTGGARNICVQLLRSLVEDLCRMALFIEKILLINLVAFTGDGCSCL
jgi:hypothetical protein